MNPPIKPANEFRIGNIKAAVWRNDYEGSVRYNVTFSRSYRDAEHWRSSDSFGRDDLLVVSKLADHAHTWICSQGRDSRLESPVSTAASARTESPNGAVAAAREKLLRGASALSGRSV